MVEQTPGLAEYQLAVPALVASPLCDLSIAVTPFDLSQRQKVDAALLSPAKNKDAVLWTKRFFNKKKIDPQHVRTDLVRYLDQPSVGQAIDAFNAAHPKGGIEAGTGPIDAVFVEAVHQFQKRSFLPKKLSAVEPFPTKE